jgi:hypothetical protein
VAQLLLLVHKLRVEGHCKVGAQVVAGASLQDTRNSRRQFLILETLLNKTHSQPPANYPCSDAHVGAGASLQGAADRMQKHLNTRATYASRPLCLSRDSMLIYSATLLS